MNKPKVFKLHFNRINMQRGLDTVWTIHQSGKCIPAREVYIDVPISTCYKPEARQPRAWFSGIGFVKKVGNNAYLITDR